MLTLSKQGLKVQPCCSYASYSTLQITNTVFQNLHLIGKNKSVFSILPVIPGAPKLMDHWRQSAYTGFVLFP